MTDRLLAGGAALLLLAPLPAAAQADWPEGEGRALVQSTCNACHRTNLIERSMGYTPDGWRELIQSMVELDGAELETIAGYLGEAFPPEPARAVEVPGDMRLGWREFVSPTPGQRTRDPVEAPDGAIWWAGMWADLLGRADPATGEITEFPLPAGAHPHTVTAGPDGTIWYTGNGNGTVGRLDPATGEVTEYPMPDPAARDPHSAIVGGDGTVWFTLQQSNMVGRLDPDTAEVRLVTMPVAGSRPYGIKLSSAGVPWVAANGSNRLYRIDPATMAVEQHELPDPGTTVRRLDFAGDDTIWYVNSALGRIGHYDPRTRQAREWPSPSGPDAHPYAIAVVDGAVWYNESGVRPDMLVRFDPRTEAFQSWPIPSGGIHAGIVRHMRPTKAGGLLIHQSATNRVILVTPAPAG
jgi:virginiamycin B lyase